MPDQTQRKKKKKEQKAYLALADSMTPRPPLFRNAVRAFALGGLISSIGQGVMRAFIVGGMTENQAIAPTLAVLTLAGAVLTGLSIYRKLGENAGAGALVPITGLASSVVAAAMDFKREGFILAMGAKMFIIAGPVLVYGILAGVLAALLRWAQTR